MTSFDRSEIERAFSDLGHSAVAAGKIVEIAVYGGAALVLTVQGRAATRDVDVAIANDAAWLRGETARLARERGWPADWLNDGVKGFLSTEDASSRRLFKTYPDEARPGLRVLVAGPEYLFAMKCMAMRIGGAEATQDRADIERLASHLGITDAVQALALVSRYYPGNQITPKTQFGVEEIFGMGSQTP